MPKYPRAGEGGVEAGRQFRFGAGGDDPDRFSRQRLALCFQVFRQVGRRSKKIFSGALIAYQ